jgi:hypothetical protein
MPPRPGIEEETDQQEEEESKEEEEEGFFSYNSILHWTIPALHRNRL